MILIITNKRDVSADFVVRALQNRNQEMLRLNTEDLVKVASTIHLPIFSYTVRNKNRNSNLARTLRSVWFRRPGKPFETDYEKSFNPEVVYVQNQWRAFIEGLQSIEDVLWINNPYSNRMAENKIRQLYIARKIGFKIPDTCITSSKEEALKFYNKHGENIIAKALDAPFIEYRRRNFFIYTNTVGAIDNIDESEISVSPIIFQERILPKVDYRLTLVGHHCFPVQVDIQNKDLGVDWRSMKESTRFTKTVIPEDILEKSIKLLETLGLVFGAIDIVAGKDGFYFLEINPNGEWGWLQKNLDLPIAETIADALISVN